MSGDEVYRGTDSSARDAFGRWRISGPTTLFDSQSQYDLSPLLFNNVESGSGAAITHMPDQSAVGLTITTAGTYALRQTREYMRYQPGKSQAIDVTFTLAPAQANLLQEVGYGDDGNGVFLQYRGTVLGFTRRSSGSGAVAEEFVKQASWNVDTFDGNGPSRLTLDPTKAHILSIDLQWLGVGVVRCGFNIDGAFWEAHRFRQANRSAGVYMTTANLPVRWLVSASGALGADATLQAICCAVISEGGFEDERGLPFCAATVPAGVTGVDDTETFVMAIRPAATFNDVVNRSAIRLRELYGYSQEAPVVLAMMYGATITGGAWAAVDDESAVELNLTGATTGGIVIARTFIPTAQFVKQSGNAQKPLTSKLPLTLDHAGENPTCIAITATRVGASGTAIVGAGVSWDEHR